MVSLFAGSAVGGRSETSEAVAVAYLTLVVAVDEVVILVRAVRADVRVPEQILISRTAEAVGRVCDAGETVGVTGLTCICTTCEIGARRSTADDALAYSVE